MTYELINPSDEITFKAESDKVAFFCALILGNGKAGISRQDGKEVEQSPMLMFHEDALSVIESYLGCGLSDFADNNLNELSDCFLSFAYVGFSGLAFFDLHVASLWAEVNLQASLKDHENRNRSSISRWVKGAWEYGKTYKNKLNEVASL